MGRVNETIRSSHLFCPRFCYQHSLSFNVTVFLLFWFVEKDDFVGEAYGPTPCIWAALLPLSVWPAERRRRGALYAPLAPNIGRWRHFDRKIYETGDYGEPDCWRWRI